MASFVVANRFEDSRRRRRLLAVIGFFALLVGATPVRAVTFIKGVDVYTGDGVVNW
jgi:hypothetical protein